MSFKDYYLLSEKLVHDKQTTGSNPTDADLVGYTKLNFHRTKRILKQVNIPDSISKQIKSIGFKWYWLVLSEPWCGDAANILPIITRLSELNSNIELRIFLRDEHPELMDRFLTDGKRAIPKLVCYDEAFSQLGEWGSRPSALQKFVDQLKKEATVSSAELKTQIQLWYNKDKGQSFLNEFGTQLLQWKEKERVG